MGFEVDDKKLKRAGLDYWYLLDIFYYDGIEDFYRKNPGCEEMCYYYTTKAKKVYSDQMFPQKVYLIFGREDAGLPESLLVKHPRRCLRLPMINEARSLNLSNAVAVAVYEVLRQHKFDNLSREGNLTRYQWE